MNKGIFLLLLVTALMVGDCQGLLTSSVNRNHENQLISVPPPELPLYWGWFPSLSDSLDFLAISKHILQQVLREVPEFLADAEKFTGQKGIENILQNYTREDPSNGVHCTAMYNGIYPNYTAGAIEYYNRPEVQAAIDHFSTIHSIGWIFTPRSFGARLKLTVEQIAIWNGNDNEGNNGTVPAEIRQKPLVRLTDLARKENNLEPVPQDPDTLGNFSPTKGKGSRAHFTLGNSPGVPAVTTGWDLVDIIQLEQSVQAYPTYTVTAGWLRNYGSNQWVIYPKYQFQLESTFRGGSL